MTMWLTLFKYASAPVRVHLSIALVFLFFYLKQEDISSIHYALSYLILILIHEMGHAYFARKCLYNVVSINIFPLHGACRFEHDSDHNTKILVFAGGLIAQAILFVSWGAVLGVLRILEQESLIGYLQPVTYSFIWVNVLIMILNVLPIPGLDGFEILTRTIAYSARKRQPDTTSGFDNRSASEIVDSAIKKAKINTM